MSPCVCHLSQARPAARPLCAVSKRQQERAEREAARAEREANRIELDENDEAMVVPTDADRDFIDDEVRWPTCIQPAMRAACHAMPRLEPELQHGYH